MFTERFKDQVAVIIGGASGIGKAVAGRFLEEGATVCLVDAANEKLTDSEEEFAAKGFQTATHCCDICDEIGLNRVFKKIVSENGRIDILVNSAGIVGPTATKILEYSLKDFKKVLEVNLTGAFIATKAVLPQMMEQNYGRIIHLTSIGGKEGNPGMVSYVASKSGLMGLIKGVGKEYAQHGITVNGVAPAVIGTPMNKDTSADMLAYMTAKIPMGRLGTTDEVAALVCWIASKEASFNTGFVFDLSGGRATY